MFLGALVDAGVAPQTLEDTVAALNVGARLEISRVLRSGISATKVDVWVNGQKDLPREEYWERKEHEHSHDDQHEHGHAHSHSLHGEVSRAEPALSLSKGVPAPHEHSHSHGRGLTEIRQIISAASISGRSFLRLRFPRLRRRQPSQSSRRSGGRRPRFTILPSSTCTFTRSAPWMRWSISSVRRWGPRRWEWMRLSARP